ncbi:hypothetical protein BU17DRAFT_94213 [Hysterangium stoloniferum]|nr:hypothetical protein BU17DRAFT_94213 [Hysterangium stoloniferum]
MPLQVTFTPEDDNHMIVFLAENCPSPKSRANRKIWQPLVKDNDWGQRHPLESWLNRYKNNREYFDHQIAKYSSTRRRSFSPIIPVSTHGQFSNKDDERLVEFLAQYLCGRRKRNISWLKQTFVYADMLCAHPEEYPWAKAHSAKAWQKRYITHMDAFNKRINDSRLRLQHMQQSERDSDNLQNEENDMVGNDEEESEQDDEGHELDSRTPVGQELKRQAPEGADTLSANRSSSSKRRKIFNEDVNFLKSATPARSNLDLGRKTGDEAGESSEGVTEIQPGKPAASEHPVIEEIRGRKNISVPKSGDPSGNSSTFSEESPSEASEFSKSNDEHKDRDIATIATPKSHPPPPSLTPMLSDQFSPPVVLHPGVVSCSSEGLRPDPMHNFSPLPSPVSSQSRYQPPASNASVRVHASYAYAPLHFVKQAQRHSPCSESDPFATSPAHSARPANVTYCLPRPRSDASFRDSDRVRDRVYLLDQKVQYAPRHKQPSTGATNGQSSTALHGQEEIRIGREAPSTMESSSSGNAAKTSSNNPLSTMSFGTATIRQAAQSPLGNDVRRRHSGTIEFSGCKKVFTFPTEIVELSDIVMQPPAPPIVQSVEVEVSGYLMEENNIGAPDGEDPVPNTDPSDVFKNTPRVSRDGCEQYALKAPYLPGPSTASSDQTQPSSPTPRRGAQRDKLRRRTFNGLKSRSSLPNIDLMAKLGERASTRTPAFNWTKRSAYENKSLVLHSSTRSLPVKTLKATRRTSSPSTIALPSDFDDNDLPKSLIAMSPLSYNHIFRTGINTILKQLESNHGFSADVIRRAWISQNMDLHATDKLLLRMRIAAEKASLIEDADVFPGGITTDRIAKGTHVGSSGQNISVLTPASDVESDYTPPPRSKAEEYRRLSAQDRFPRFTHQTTTPHASELGTSSGMRSDGGHQFSGSIQRISVQSDAMAKLVSAAPMASSITPFPRPKHPPKLISTSHAKLQPAETGQHSTPIKPGTASKAVRSTEPIWSTEDDDVLRSGDTAMLEDLVTKFGDDNVRRRFLRILRE